MQHSNHYEHSGAFGCWIGPDNIVHAQRSDPIIDPELASSADPCEKTLSSYELGFVMARFERNSSLEITGRSDAIMRCKQQWLALARAVNQITVVLVRQASDSMNDLMDPPTTFAFPEQQDELSNYLKSVS